MTKPKKPTMKRCRIFRITLWQLPEKDSARAAQGDFENAHKIFNRSKNRVPNVKPRFGSAIFITKQGNAEKAKQQYDLVEVIEQKIGINNDQKRFALLVG